MKFCIVRKVPFKLPNPKARIVWANIICEYAGLALVLVPQIDSRRPHSIFIAQENVTERVFEAVGPYRFDLETDDVVAAGNKLRMLGKSFEHDDFLRNFRFEDFL
jgi:hypothetical protein